MPYQVSVCRMAFPRRRMSQSFRIEVKSLSFRVSACFRALRSARRPHGLTATRKNTERLCVMASVPGRRRVVGQAEAADPGVVEYTSDEVPSGRTAALSAWGPSMNYVYTLLQAGRLDGEARATSILSVCKERATKPAGLPAAAHWGAAAGGHLLRCRSSTMTPHRLRRGALHLPARRSRQSANVIH